MQDVAVAVVERPCRRAVVLELRFVSPGLTGHEERLFLLQFGDPLLLESRVAVLGEVVALEALERFHAGGRVVGRVGQVEDHLALAERI